MLGHGTGPMPAPATSQGGAEQLSPGREETFFVRIAHETVVRAPCIFGGLTWLVPKSTITLMVTPATSSVPTTICNDPSADLNHDQRVDFSHGTGPNLGHDPTVTLASTLVATLVVILMAAQGDT